MIDDIKHYKDNITRVCNVNGHVDFYFVICLWFRVSYPRKIKNDCTKVLFVGKPRHYRIVAMYCN